MKRLLFFGAGASFGSENSSPYCPPLGAGLFDELQKLYPEAWGILPASKRPLFVPNFEPGMKDLWESGWHGTSVLMNCLADFFARFRPLPGNTYGRLLEQLAAQNAIRDTWFSTLNYDCILEYAGRHAGFTLQYFAETPTTSSEMTVWKIHGSCNFIPQSAWGSSGAVTYSADNVQWDGDLRIVDAEQVAAVVQSNAFYPAMAVFMEGKPVHSNPSAIERLQTLWTDAVMNADKIGIIGVHPNIADSYIWTPLAATKAPLVVIGDANAFANWQKAYRPSGVVDVVGNRFAPSLNQFVTAFCS